METRRELGAGAEVHQDRSPSLLAHHVLRLHVSMHEAAAVDGGQGPAQIDANRDRFLRAQRSARAQLVVQCASVDELHPQAGEIVGPLDTVNDDDVLVPDLGEQ